MPIGYLSIGVVRRPLCGCDLVVYASFCETEHVPQLELACSLHLDCNRRPLDPSSCLVLGTWYELTRSVRRQVLDIDGILGFFPVSDLCLLLQCPGS